MQYFLPIMSLLSFACMWTTVVQARATSRRDDLAVVHTFDTREMCMSRCRTTCTHHHSEDLMMPRWQCPLQEDDTNFMDEEEEDLLTSNLLFIIPTLLIGSVIFLFVCISCVQRFCKNDY
ncbi:unnamed protein product [Auanema sp. JU1783]|nr:unnamed protein product [Auanema sp. JU1783]